MLYANEKCENDQITNPTKYRKKYGIKNEHVRRLCKKKKHMNKTTCNENKLDSDVSQTTSF